jgi:hypothetical protein
MDAVSTLGPDEYAEEILQAVISLGPHDVVTASVLAASVLDANPRLARGRSITFDGATRDDDRLPPEVWARQVRRLLLAHGRLDGTLLIVGLTLLDARIGNLLAREELLPSLKADAHRRSAGLFARLRHFTPDFDSEAIDFVRSAANGATQALALDSVLLVGSLAAAAPALADLVRPSEDVYLSPQRLIENPEDVLITRELAAAFQRARKSGPIGVVSLLGALFDPTLSQSDQPLVQRVLALNGLSREDAAQRVRGFLEGRPGVAAQPLAPSAIRLAGYDPDTVSGVRDRLGVERDVAALSALVAAERISPPLSIGLFGDWGSGKSFFIERMRERVHEFHGKPDFCRRIVQVEFNAWHYLDANLWASLVTHIFDKLFDVISEPEKIGDRLKDAQGLFSAAQADHERAKKNVAVAEAGLTEAQRERVAQERSFASLADDLRGILSREPQVEAALRTAAGKIGISPAIQSYDELKDNVAEIHTLAGRVTAIAHTVLSNPVRNLSLLGAFLVLPIALGALIELSNQQFWKELRWIANTTSTLAALVAWLSTQVKSGDKWIRKVEDAYARVSAARQQRIDDSETEERALLQLARERETAAKKRLEDATLQLQRIEREVNEQKPGPRLRRFIEDRGASSDYAKHLSIVTLIRKDFEELSRLIDTRDEALPIDRIVLYIDDLDRCRPQRVIEVLEAVHLLLAFRLFVVVVAVDPRWLNRCLELHYPQLLGPRTASDMDTSSPQDYLEKIFQIPFMVHPIDVMGYRKLVRSLVTADDENGESIANVPVAPLASDTPTTETPLSMIATQKLPKFVDPEPKLEPQSAELQPQSAEPPPEAPVVQTAAATVEDILSVEPQQLDLQSWERDALEALAPLFTTPRSVKRFVNIYRLMRVSLLPSELAAFEGTMDKPGDHRAVLLLLALVTNYPRVSAHLLNHLGRTGDVLTWSDLIARLSEGAGVLPDGLSDDDGRDWKLMCSRLCELAPEHLPGALVTSRAWTPRVVRYSFFVAPRR